VVELDCSSRFCIRPALERARYRRNRAAQWYREASPFAGSDVGKLHGSSTCPMSSAPAMKSIVIVDDSPTIRRMVRAALAGIPAGRFIEAGSGLEAIEQLTLGPVGLMVLDLNMPDMQSC
jgi:PleD family two-component response regulator